ncbi:MAG: hypothetical protein AAGJ82_14030 [Bacteroidota bacterium]
MKKYFHFLSIFLFTTSVLFGQTDTVNFPTDWLGEWTGDLVISTTQGQQMNVPMILRITPVADRYTYTIVYGEDTPENTRGYFLQAVPDEPGHFQVDEDNGIILDDYFIGNKLYSRFEVMGSLLLSTLEARGDQLIYEIISGAMEPVVVTGDTIIAGDTIPPVNSFGVRVQQRAVLTRSGEGVDK